MKNALLIIFGGFSLVLGPLSFASVPVDDQGTVQYPGISVDEEADYEDYEDDDEFYEEDYDDDDPLSAYEDEDAEDDEEEDLWEFENELYDLREALKNAQALLQGKQTVSSPLPLSYRPQLLLTIHQIP